MPAGPKRRPKRHAGPGHARGRVTTAGRRIARKAAARAHPERRASRSRTEGLRAPTKGSPRFEAARAALDGHLQRLFPGVERVEAYGMHGWRVPRPRQVEWTHGAVDPNLVQLFLAERSQGISLHLWNPYDHGMLSKRRDRLADAGFKVMVGCVQYNRKGDYPVDAIVPLLEAIAKDMDKERAQAERAE